ncbi:MAG: hypothetical protein E6R04_10260 [Spirochaetes bacterium]|nr:MAG: hypothetical protein E6R04_10260 [Spirochaetota bacterium]
MDSNTQITLTQNYTGLTDVGQTFNIKPASPRRNLNRKFSIAGHALRELDTTITAISSDTEFTLASVQDLLVGDTVIINSQYKVVRKIFGLVVTLTAPLNAPATIGDAVLRPAIQNVYLNNRALTRTTDYTYSATDGTLLLNVLAEVNVAPILSIPGTVTFNGTTAVTGSSTFFKKDVKISDWIKLSGQNDFYEVLSVNSDTSITLRSAAGYSGTTTALIKSPEYYEEGKVVLSCDVLGATDDGTTDGALLEKCGDIVADLLDRAGLTSLMAAATFDSANIDNDARLGITIPAKFDSKKVPTHRDIINVVNKSVFGSLVQNEDFELEYQILLPKKTSVTVFNRTDVVKFSVDSSSDRVIKTAKVNYRPLEYDISSGESSVSQATATSEYGQYLAKTENTFEIDTYLIDDDRGQIYANRWGFILGIGTSIVKIETKLQGARLQATDKVELQHEKLYERYASSDQRRIGAIRYVKQNAFTVSIEVEDVGNAFSRCASITENDATEFASATDSEKAYDGYITDDYGMQDNDPETAGNNLIW